MNQKSQICLYLETDGVLDNIKQVTSTIILKMKMSTNVIKVLVEVKY